MQGAGFYCDLHRKAVDYIPSGDGKTWIDFSCGPGLVSRMAATNHYVVVDIDTDPAMIKAARRLAKWQGSSARFEEGNLTSSSKRSADVISAASLLTVPANRTDTLEILWDGIPSSGHLLIIEPTERMNPDNAHKMIESGLPEKRLSGLKLWASRESQPI